MRAPFAACSAALSGALVLAMAGVAAAADPAVDMPVTREPAVVTPAPAVGTTPPVAAAGAHPPAAAEAAPTAPAGSGR